MGRSVLQHQCRAAPTFQVRFLSGYQCHKLLWNVLQRTDQIPRPDAAQQAIFDQGHEVGALAKSLYPCALRSARTRRTSSRCFRIRLRIECEEALFERGFVYNGGLARVDILNPVAKDAWDIIEVKAAHGGQDVNLIDLAFQAFVYSGAGLNIRRCFVMHVDAITSGVARSIPRSSSRP